MSDVWVAVPDRRPWKCPFTHQSDPGGGPYLQTRLQYFIAIDDGAGVHPDRHPHQLYLSGQAIKEACDLPGSPLVCLSKEQYSELEQRLLEANEQITSLLDDAVERDRRDAALDPQAIAAAVAEHLGDTFARKTGRKKAEPEMSRR